MLWGPSSALGSSFLPKALMCVKVAKVCSVSKEAFVVFNGLGVVAGTGHVFQVNLSTSQLLRPKLYINCVTSERNNLSPSVFKCHM